MSKIIGNRFGAFGTLSTGELAPREEEVHIANATIAAGVSVEFDTSYAITNGHMRVITSDAANAVKNVGVSLTGAGAGDEVRVVVRGPVQMTSNATVAVGTGVGTTAAGLAAAPATPSGTVKNIGFALEALSAATTGWVYVAPW
jgi:hypothetical protein